MRKIAEILLIVLTVVLFCTAFLSCSISKKKSGQRLAASLAGAFSCVADVSLDGHDYTVNIVRLKDGDTTVQFVKPTELSPLSFVSDSTGLHMRYGTLQTDVDTSAMPSAAVPTALLDAFNAAAENATVSLTDSGTVLKGETTAGPFSVTFDASGNLTALRLPRQSLSARISHFSTA